MPKSVRPRRRARRADVRNLFAAHIFGTHSENSVGTLKEHLHNEGLLESSDTKLDTVMIDDVEHFFELVAEHGIPLARDGEPEYLVPRGVRIPISPWLFLAVSAALFLLVLDDVLRILLNVDILPWF